MTESANWKFAVEVHPAGWNFPEKNCWIAGWIKSEPGKPITDVRARIHDRIILGLSGLPHPAFKENPADPTALVRPGFSFLLRPQPGASLLRLEARGPSGRWTEFFRTKISVAPAAFAPPVAPDFSRSLGRLVAILVQRRRRAPGRTWADLADELIASFVAEPLNAHPNLPFIGALEEPHTIGRLRYGRIPVTGWLAHPNAKISRLIAVIDPLPATTLQHGVARSDIAGVFPVLVDQASSAFVGEIALPPDLASPVLLKVFAELAHGEQHLVFAQRFTPQFHRETGQMPPFVEGRTFVRAVWALHRAARRQALPGKNLLAAARAVWAEYRATPAYRPKKPSPLLEKIRRRADHPTPAGEKHAPENFSPALQGRTPACTVIAPADDMCVPDATQYFLLGREALSLIQHACALAGCERIEAILDLPSGFGRVARWLRTAYPTARLTVSDIQQAGVAFCEEHLEATGVPANVEGSHWALLPGPYDMIWCGSLLTHFDRDAWLDHLRRFAERLTPHGVLVFTTHGLLALDNLQSGEKDYGLPQAAITQLCHTAVTEGFGYVDYPDSPSYGISVSVPEWIFELIEGETDLQVIDLREAAWDQHQDVVVCVRRPKPGRQ